MLFVIVIIGVLNKDVLFCFIVIVWFVVGIGNRIVVVIVVIIVFIVIGIWFVG